MSKIKFFFLFFFIILQNNSVYAENKIVYIDLDFILSNVNIGKKLFEKLNNNENSKFEEFKIKEQNLKNQENKILASKNLISENQLKIDIDQFKNKLEAYKSKKKKDLEKLQKIRNDEVTNLLNSINVVIQKYMSENSISIIIDKKNVYIADKNYDISNDLIEIINKNFK